MARKEARWKGFVEGGLASVVAGTLTHPLDLVKVRMQLQAEVFMPRHPALVLGSVTSGTFSATLGFPAVVEARPGPIAVGLRIAQVEGMGALFSGVSATVLRQGVYSSSRMGIYEILKEACQEKRADGKVQGLPLHKKIIAGLVSGGLGAAVGNPADLVMVRMQADGRLAPHLRRNYRHVGDALWRIGSEEGVAVLWRGCGPTVQRAMVVTASQLATYDQAKEALLSGGLRDGMAAHVAASFTAGLVASVTSCPLDVVKTRLMEMKAEGGQAPRYSGALDCALKLAHAEGLSALYKGFVPTVLRQGPFTVILFVTLEQVRHLLAPL